MFRSRKRDSKGGALIETVAGLMILLPVVLALIDFLGMVAAQTMNDALAKDCARAAAVMPDIGQAQTAVNAIRAQYGAPTITITGAQVLNHGATTLVRTDIIYTFPIPIPLVGTGSMNFSAEATEPVTGVGDWPAAYSAAPS